MASQKVTECVETLLSKNWTIAFVESATAGKLSYEFSTVIDSGKILMGGIVCYSISMKENFLSIPASVIEEFTPESAEVTRLMAQNFSDYSESDVCVAITGLTTPGGSETSEKPVGTIFLHIVFPHKLVAQRFEFKGSPEEIVNQAIDEIAALILMEIPIT
jgi:nicotinamide-nucleotide amidase